MLAIDPDDLPQLSERSVAVRELHEMLPSSEMGTPLFFVAAERLEALGIDDDEQEHIMTCLRARSNAAEQAHRSARD